VGLVLGELKQRTDGPEGGAPDEDFCSDRSTAHPAAPDRHAGCWPAKALEPRRPFIASRQASFFGLDVLQQLFVKRQIGDELLQLLVLPLELPQPLHIRWYQSAIFLAQA
jgi:hypothetical protein